jgi:uncharacterized protein (TIGR02145 family)
MKPKILIYAMCVFLTSFFSCDTENNPDNGKSGIKFNSNLTYGSVTDQEGNTYKTIQIGDQTWMAENLRTTKYNDGIAIPNVTDVESLKTLTTGAYINVNNRVETDSILLYGRLYNFFAVYTGKLAPAGWHVATYADWTKLITYLGGENLAGGKVKETGIIHWKADNTGATNESGFTAIPAGYCTPIAYTGQKNFESIFMGAYFWQKDNYGSQTAASVYLFYNTEKMMKSTAMKYSGLSVRCVKD